MFRAAEVGNQLSKEEYEAIVPQMRVDLLNAQFDLRSADFAVVVILMGDDRLGVNLALGRLHEWMDARGIQTHFYGDPTEDERERPFYWRFWRDLPADGTIGIFLGAWMATAMAGRLRGRLDDAGLHYAIDRIRRLEKDLVEDGTVLLKFWLHLPAGEYRKRLKHADKDSSKAWWIGDEEYDLYAEHYDKAMSVCEHVIEKTGTGAAPWHVIESTDDRYRDVRIARTVLAAIQRRLQGPDVTPAPPAQPPATPEVRTVLDTVDLSKSYERKVYRKKLEAQQARLRRLTRDAWAARVATVLVFEGWDAAGKGGAIRRITAATDARLYRVIPIAAPTDEEKAHHHLWRFWRHVPRDGRVRIFDRSWYGRVLVERVEGFATEDQWRRAYAEIRDFEEQLRHHGVVVQKFWLHISPEEQLARFQAREQTPYKKYKITDDDYRNRARWAEYEAAVNEMVARTSTSYAPWHLVPANSKRYARVQVLKRVCNALEERLRT